jgi:CHAT domain-containing protein
LGAFAQAQEQESEDYVQAVTALLQEKTGKAPQPQEIVDALSNRVVEIYQKGDYRTGVMIAEQTFRFAEQKLGPEHLATLSSVNNLAALYESQGRYGDAEPLFQRALTASEKMLGPEHPATLRSVNNLALLYDSQGRYGEAEPLYQRALAASEKVLGPEHPQTLTVQLNYTATLVNLKQPRRALQLLERMEPRLLELAALQLRHTRQEVVRRLFLTSQANFQDVVLTLALNNPEPDSLDLAAKVMLRWKQIQGEEEAFLARLVRRRSEKDSEVRKLAKQIAELRRDLSHLANLPEPDTDLQRKKLNELEAKEIRLAQISREFNRYLQVRGANVDDVRHSLPRDSGALLELRLYQPANFKTGKLGEPHWAALLLPAAGEISLHDLGPVAATQDLVQKLRVTHARADAAALYKHLFGTLDDKLKRYDPLYIAPDGFLSLLAFAELVTPDGRYWIQRQTLRQVSTGRHLIAAYDQDLDKPKSLLALGGVDYDGFGAAKEPTPQQPKQTDPNLTVAMRAVSNEIGQFKALAETGKEAEEVKNAYWSYWNIPSQVWLGADASESRLKTLATPPRVLHLTTHGFYLSEKSGIVDRPMVLSGLALAGANQGLKGKAGPDGEDGILYALEVQDLNLEDTELVALSACDTGKGTLDYSEGVYGLTRAFRTAGARNVLMSLWPLGDQSAREFMARFYRTWLNGPKPKDLAVTLRETQLSFIQDENEQLRHPQVWAPFVLIEGP